MLNNPINDAILENLLVQDGSTRGEMNGSCGLFRKYRICKGQRAHSKFILVHR